MLTPPAVFNPDPPPPDFNNREYRALVEREALRVATITAALTAIARYVPGKAGKLAGFVAVAFLGEPGENKKGNIGGAKTNPLPAPIGFSDPKVYGLKPNFYLPDGATQFIPQPVDIIGLGLNQQRVADQSADQRRLLDEHRKYGAQAAALSAEDFLRQNKPIPQPFGLITSERIFGGKRDRLARNTAFANEALFRANPNLRAFIDRTGFVPTEVLTPAFFNSVDDTFPFALDGSILPEKIQPIEGRAIDNAARAKGINRQLVHERADP